MNKIEREKTIQKIKRCLALSKSANEHEAANAMRQAKALMDKFQIDENDPLLLGISEAGAQSGAGSRPPRWESMLARVVGNYLDCDIYFSGGITKGDWKFIGIDPAPEIASYAFKVLSRQVRKARKDYIATALKRVRNQQNKIGRADAFCEGWITTASKVLGKFKINPDIAARIKNYTEQKCAEFTTLKPTTRKLSKAVSDVALGDKYAGRIAGENAQLHNAMNGNTPPELIGS